MNIRDNLSHSEANEILLGLSPDKFINNQWRLIYGNLNLSRNGRFNRMDS